MNTLGARIYNDGKITIDYRPKTRAGLYNQESSELLPQDAFYIATESTGSFFSNQVIADHVAGKNRKEMIKFMLDALKGEKNS